VGDDSGTGATVANGGAGGGASADYGSIVQDLYALKQRYAQEKQRLDALRTAFDETMVDPAFVEQLAKLAFDLRPQRGAEVQARIERVLNERSDVMPQLKALLNLN